MMKPGYTLTELLVSLTILGVIATFTIPKMLAVQEGQSKLAATKEAMATVSSAYSILQLRGQVTTNTVSSDLIPYLNYVKTETIDIDATPGSSAWECGDWGDCIRLHNGGVMGFPSYKFGGTTQGNYIMVIFDPDGGYSGITTGSGKSVEIMLHYNGRLKTTAQRNASTDITYESWSGSAVMWGADSVPSWFHW